MKTRLGLHILQDNNLMVGTAVSRPPTDAASIPATIPMIESDLYSPDDVGSSRAVERLA